MEFAGAEEEVLVLATALHPESASNERLQSLLARQSVDWSRIIRLAEANRVTSLLQINLDRLPLLPVPEDIKTRLEFLRYRHTQHNLRLKAELLRVLAAFAEQDLPVMPLKGPVFAELYYGSLSLRETMDLDIIVPRSVFFDASTLLSDLGYSSVHGTWSSIPNSAYHVNMRHASNNLILELHWQIAESRYPRFRDPAFLWEDALHIDYGNRKILIPTTEKMLLFLSIHAFRHYWKRLRWIYDIAQVVESTPDLNWQYLNETAAELHASNILRMNLSLAGQFQKLQLPGSALENLPKSRATRRVTKQVNRFIMGYDEGSAGSPRASFRRMLLLDSVPDQYRLISSSTYSRAQRILTPNRRDFEWVSLPRQLSFLYYLVRPVRLASERLPRLFRSSLR